jgi:hypothetical protein
MYSSQMFFDEKGHFELYEYLLKGSEVIYVTSRPD